MIKRLAAALTLLLTLSAGLATQRAEAAAPRPTAVTWFTPTGCSTLINAQRAKYGRKALVYNRNVTIAAMRQAYYQAYTRKMSHTGAGGSSAGDRLIGAGYRWSAWAENAAAGQTSCASVVGAWMNSAPHRANILSTSVVHLGIAAAKSSNGVVYWTMVEARPL